MTGNITPNSPQLLLLLLVIVVVLCKISPPNSQVCTEKVFVGLCPFQMSYEWLLTGSGKANATVFESKPNDVLKGQF